MEESPGFEMMGSSFDPSESTITDLCHVAATYTHIDDIASIVSLQQELQDRIFHIMWNIICNAPSPLKWRRK